MKVRIWRSFSSNNSGSYTLVGRFATVEEAADVARTLAVLIAEVESSSEEELAAPVRRFAIEHDLPGPVYEDDDDWPQHDERPVEAEALGRQVVVHHPYTLSLFRQIGEYVYRRGGRVEVELGHTHGHDLALFTFALPSDDERAEALEAALRARAGGIAELLGPDVAPVVTRDPTVLRYAAVWTDLPGGVRAVRALAETAGADVSIKVWAASGRWLPGEDGGFVFDRGDPFTALR